MNRPGKTWISTVALFTALCFFLQVFSAFADHAGLMPCADQVSEHSTMPAKSGGDNASQHCCCVHSTFGLADADVAFRGADLLIEPLCLTDEARPEGTIREIDHPPQLS